MRACAPAALAPEKTAAEKISDSAANARSCRAVLKRPASATAAGAAKATKVIISKFFGTFAKRQHLTRNDCSCFDLGDYFRCAQSQFITQYGGTEVGLDALDSDDPFVRVAKELLSSQSTQALKSKAAMAEALGIEKNRLGQHIMRLAATILNCDGLHRHLIENSILQSVSLQNIVDYIDAARSDESSMPVARRVDEAEMQSNSNQPAAQNTDAIVLHSGLPFHVPGKLNQTPSKLLQSERDAARYENLVQASVGCHDFPQFFVSRLFAFQSE